MTQRKFTNAPEEVTERHKKLEAAFMGREKVDNDIIDQARIEAYLESLKAIAQLCPLDETSYRAKIFNEALLAVASELAYADAETLKRIAQNPSFLTEAIHLG